MSDTEKLEIEAFNEAMERVEMTKEELYAENIDLQKQIELHRQQLIKLEDRYNSEKDQWRQYRRDMLAENDTLRDQVLLLNHAVEKEKITGAKERSHRVATVPRLVVIAAVALALCAIPFALQKLCIIGPQLAFSIDAGLLMAISWCYALIWDRTRK